MDALLSVSADRATITNAAKLDTPASVSAGNINTSIESPDVRVDLSDTSRQLAAESKQQEQVQSLNDSQNLSASVETPVKENQPQTLSNNEEEPSATESLETSLDEVAELSTTTPNEVTLETNAPVSTQNLGTLEESTPPTTAETRNQPTQSAEPNVSKSASVVTQYNTSPESALGQSISIQV